MRSKEALLKEKRRLGWYDDRAGRRYRISVNFVVGGEPKGAYTWRVQHRARPDF